MSHNIPTYNPYGAYELKRTYQRNIGVAQLSVVALVALIVGSIALYNRLTREDTVTVTRQEIDRSVHVINLMMEKPNPVKRHITAAKPEKPKDLGLLDKIQATPDAPEFEPADSSLIYSDKPTADDGDSVQSYSDLIGDTGVGIYPPAHLPLDTVVEPDIVPCSVLVAVRPEYPRIALDRRQDGAAGIMVCIDETGKVTLFPKDIVKVFKENRRSVEKVLVPVNGQEQWLTIKKATGKDENGHKRQFNYVVTYEEPSGWFFADKVAEIMPKWAFAPSRVHGKLVKSLIPIGHAFCVTGDCQFEYKVLRNYKQYGSVDTR